MWPTIDGMRMLRGREAALVRAAIGTMLDHLVAEYRDRAEAWPYGIDTFDCWDADQRIWMIHQVTLALLTRKSPLPAAAIWEATVDVVFCEVVDLIEIEITAPDLSPQPCSWRQAVIDAFVCQHSRAPEISAEEPSLAQWRKIVSQIVESVLVGASYQKAEALRDSDYQRMQQFLQQRGLPADFMDVIPPIRSVAQTQASIDQIQALVCRPG